MADLCAKHAVSQAQYYKWRDAFLREFHSIGDRKLTSDSPVLLHICQYLEKAKQYGQLTQAYRQFTRPDEQDLMARAIRKFAPDQLPQFFLNALLRISGLNAEVAAIQANGLKVLLEEHKDRSDLHPTIADAMIRVLNSNPLATAPILSAQVTAQLNVSDAVGENIESARHPMLSVALGVPVDPSTLYLNQLATTVPQKAQPVEVVPPKSHKGHIPDLESGLHNTTHTTNGIGKESWPAASTAEITHGIAEWLADLHNTDSWGKIGMALINSRVTEKILFSIVKAVEVATFPGQRGETITNRLCWVMSEIQRFDSATYDKLLTVFSEHVQRNIAFKISTDRVVRNAVRSAIGGSSK